MHVSRGANPDQSALEGLRKSALESDPEQLTRWLVGLGSEQNISLSAIVDTCLSRHSVNKSSSNVNTKAHMNRVRVPRSVSKRPKRPHARLGIKLRKIAMREQLTHRIEAEASAKSTPPGPERVSKEDPSHPPSEGGDKARKQSGEGESVIACFSNM